MTFNEIIQNSKNISGEFTNKIFANTIKFRINNLFENIVNDYIRLVTEQIGEIASGNFERYLCCNGRDQFPELSEDEKKELLIAARNNIEKEVENYAKSIGILLGIVNGNDTKEEKAEPAQSDISITIEKVTPQELFGGN